MYSPMSIALQYLRHQATASNGRGHGIHSPFVFEFVTRVLNDRTVYPSYRKIEQLRRKLLSDRSPVPIEDYGAGISGSHSVSSRSVASITAGAAKSPRLARLLYRIVHFYQPHYVLELGTSLGISTAYLAAANAQAMVITAEGNHVVASMAEKNLSGLGLGNVRVVTGNFDNTLPQMLSALPHVDLAFIDGNHREQPTISYFTQLLERMSPSSVMIFDDIHWSHGMQSAWNTICSHPSAMLTIDIFRMGFVFFRPEFKVKQHFRIRF